MPQFKDMLRYLRKRANLTQQELADKVGLTRSRINNYEQGVRQPDFETAELFADFFNVDMNTLLAKSAPAVPAMELTPEEAQLVDDYRDASPEIRGAAAVMLHTSAEANRKDGSSAASNAG